MAFRNTCAGIVCDCFLGINTQQDDCTSPQNMFLSKIFVLRYNSTLSGFFHGAFRWLFLFTIKNHLCAGDYTAAVYAIKSAQSIQENRCIFSMQEKYPSLFGKRFNLRRSQSDIQNKKTFTQQTIRAQIKRLTAWIRPHSFLRKV
jgi:hypothetical protein